MGCAVSVSFSVFPGIEVNTVNSKPPEKIIIRKKVTYDT
jgi:hypothetical protein